VPSKQGSIPGNFSQQLVREPRGIADCQTAVEGKADDEVGVRTGSTRNLKHPPQTSKLSPEIAHKSQRSHGNPTTTRQVDGKQIGHVFDQRRDRLARQKVAVRNIQVLQVLAAVHDLEKAVVARLRAVAERTHSRNAKRLELESALTGHDLQGGVADSRLGQVEPLDRRRSDSVPMLKHAEQSVRSHPLKVVGPEILEIVEDAQLGDAFVGDLIVALQAQMTQGGNARDGLQGLVREYGGSDEVQRLELAVSVGSRVCEELEVVVTDGTAVA